MFEDEVVAVDFQKPMISFVFFKGPVPVFLIQVHFFLYIFGFSLLLRLIIRVIVIFGLLTFVDFDWSHAFGLF